MGLGALGGDGKQGRFPAEGPRAALPVPAPAAPGRGTHEVWQFGVLLEELLERQGAFLQGDISILENAVLEAGRRLARLAHRPLQSLHLCCFPEEWNTTCVF